MSAPDDPKLLGRYRIEGLLGEGGMGRVYRAFDTLLRRRVALKVLATPEPPDAPAVARLLRGARAAAAFSHPHVCSVFDAGEIDGRPFIAMELIDGEPLRARIGDARVALGQRLRWVLELAGALAATHRARVVHRDIKPDNVMIDGDGRARLLDFGVAIWDDAPLEPGAPAPGAGARATQTGRAIGTPGYMAPEQLAGGPVDARSDQFAWGVLAYEAISGRHPFPSGELRGAELLSAMAPGLPFGVAAIVAKAMAIDPPERFTDMAALIGQLAPLVTAAEAPAPPRRRWSRAAGAGALVAAGAIAGGRALVGDHRDGGAAPVLQIEHPRPVTFGEGCEEFPSFLPDGRAVIYSSTDPAGESRLYRIDVAGPSTPRLLARGMGTGWDLGPVVSPRGDLIAFLHMDKERSVAAVAPLDGSEPPRVLGDATVYPRWSPDGRGIWAGRRGGVALFDVATGDELRALALPGDLRASWLVERPDGAVIAHINHGGPSVPTGVAGFGPDGRLRWQIAVRLEPALALAPDGRYAIGSRQTFAGGAELIAIPFDGAPIVSLSATGVVARNGLDVSPDGAHLAWSTCNAVVRVSMLDAAGRFTPALVGEEDNVIAVAAIPATTDLAVVSGRAGPFRLWVMDGTGARAPRPIATGERPVRGVAISPDGARFAAVLEGGGITVGSLRDGGAARAVTDQPSDIGPAFRHGGRDLVFARRPAGGQVQVMTVPVAGGPVAPLLDPGSHDAAVSPVDDRIAYLQGTPTAIPMVTDGAVPPRPLSPALGQGRYRDLRFSPDGRRIALVRGDRELVELDAATGDIVRVVAPESGDALYTPSYSAAGLVVMRARWQGNLWIADARFATAGGELAPVRR